MTGAVPPPDATDPTPPGRFARWRMALDRAARGRWAVPALFIGSFIDSTVFPWPVAFPLAAQMLRGRRFVFPAAIAVTAGSVLGCLVMYALGLLAYEALAATVLSGSGETAVEAARERMQAKGALGVFIAMTTPIPVQITSVAAALAGVGPVWFLAALIAGRVARYFSMALILYFFGEAIVSWWRRLSPLLKALTLAACAAVFAGLIVLAVAG